MATFKHVMAATDFSETSRRAVELAVSLARDTGALLTVVHACEVPAYAELPLPTEVYAAVEKEAQATMGTLLASLRDACPGARGMVKVGAPLEQLLAAAAETKADVLVLGTHGRRGVAHALLGSVAERVVRLAPIPVLTVRGQRAG